MYITIDSESGFCFGVTRAIRAAEDALANGDTIYCLGDIVHNSEEVNRLAEIGLKTIDHDTYFTLSNCNVLLRAHGEPPSTYEYAEKHNITIIDATCPIVLKLQRSVKQAWADVQHKDGQIIIYGKKGHAEVTGLEGQTDGRAIIIEDEEDIESLNFDYPLILFSQTTRSPEKFQHLAERLKCKSTSEVTAHDTICRQVSNRGPMLRTFSQQYDVIIFVGGKKSSNAKYLFEVCKEANPNCHFVSEVLEINPTWFEGKKSTGICGATSTPSWLMENVAGKIKEICEAD